MSEQSGKNERSDRPPRSGSSGADRQQGDSGTDLLGDLQRWLIRSSAKNMRRELEDQVRRTIGGQRQSRSDVWDVATTEIPPEVGEAPECQWCPICRAARRMRDSRRPGNLAGQISGAGEAVATAVQDAISALDSLLTRPGGRDSAATGGTDSGGAGANSGGTGADAGSSHAGPGGAAAGKAAGQQAGSQAEPGEATTVRPDSLAGEHGQVGWKPGDRLATAGPAAGDPWATVTDSDPDTANGTGSGSAGDPSDGRGHGPSDRG
jgi:hypothetical protein